MRSTSIKPLVPGTLLVLFIALGLAACGAGGISDPTAHGTSSSTLQPGSYGRIIETETTIHKVTIIRVTDDAQSTEAAQEPAEGKKYLTAKIMLKNVGTDGINPGQVELRTRDHTDYHPITVPGLTAAFTVPVLDRNARATATFVFEIPQDAHAKSLRYIPDPSQDAAIVFTA